MQMTDKGGRVSEHRASPLCAAVCPFSSTVPSESVVFPPPRHIVPIRLLLGQSPVLKTFRVTLDIENKPGPRTWSGKMSKEGFVDDAESQFALPPWRNYACALREGSPTFGGGLLRHRHT